MSGSQVPRSRPAAVSCTAPCLPPPVPARRPRLPAALVAPLAAFALSVAGPVHADAAPREAAGDAALLQRQFAAAAGEFGVPERVLLALAYQETRWESHGGSPSTTGNYGVLGLTRVDVAAENAAAHPVVDSPALHTLDRAAELIHRPAVQLGTDSAQNLRGGAALLAEYQKAAGATASADPGRWYEAVARFSQGGPTGTDAEAAGRVFADRVFAAMRSGAARTTSEGWRVVLPADPSLVVATPSAAVGAGTGPTGTAPARAARETPECPEGLACDFTPAAYALTDPNDPTSFGNYNPADRPEDGEQIRYLVVHDTEGEYAGAVAAFQNPHEQASAHYLVRARDGHVTQLVHTRDIAWHAANKTINMHSIGIEHEGFALPTDRPTWYSEQLYQSSAALVRYLAERFGVPLDRQHVIGHDDVPAPTQAAVRDMHWDPGTFWDWAHYLELLNAPIEAGTDAAPTPGDTVTIAPPFDARNQPPVDGVAARPENFVYLRTRPAADAPLVNGGTTAADDWSDKAVTGTAYVVADRQGDWTAIWYDGQKCWFSDPGGLSARTTPRGTAGRTVLTPRPDAPSIPVYGRAYPGAAAYAPYPAIKPPAVVALAATVPAGQAYLAADATPHPADFFYDQNINGDAPDDRTLVVGEETYYPIRFNHRLAFLKASDVQVLGPPAPDGALHGRRASVVPQGSGRGVARRQIRGWNQV